MAEISQSIGQVTFDPANPDAQLKTLTIFRNRTNTALRLIEKYSEKDGFNIKIKSIINQFFIMYPSLDERFSPALGDLESDFLNDALLFAQKDFWTKLVGLPLFQNLDTFIRFFERIENIKVLESENAQPLLDKFLSYLSPGIDEASLSKIRDVLESEKLLSAKSSDNLQVCLINFFVLQENQDRREYLLNLLTQHELNEQSANSLINDLIAKKEYLFINQLLSSEYFAQMLIEKRVADLQNLIVESDFNNDNLIKLFETLWNDKNVIKFLDSTVLEKIVNKINQLSEFQIKRPIIERLINYSIRDTIIKRGAKTEYLTFLNDIKRNISGMRQSPESRLKARITRFQNSLEGGVQNAGRQFPRGRRRS